MATKEFLELNEESRIEQARHAETLRQYEIKKRARAIVVPTDTNEIKARLRELGHPITLFGEDNADRRERLKEIIAKLELNQDEAAKIQVDRF